MTKVNGSRANGENFGFSKVQGKPSLTNLTNEPPL